jgi:hypothetical protein
VTPVAVRGPRSPRVHALRGSVSTYCNRMPPVYGGWAEVTRPIDCQACIRTLLQRRAASSPPPRGSASEERP